jgi:RNA polymerase sigma-70 factor (ECF subfamily)
MDRREHGNVTMDESTWLGTRFEEHRPRLMALATRMLGSKTEADDAMQDTWIRFSRSNTDGMENLGAWLTTVVSRVCLNTLQTRRKRSSDVFDDENAEPPIGETESILEQEALLADSA